MDIRSTRTQRALDYASIFDLINSFRALINPAVKSNISSMRYRTLITELLEHKP